MRTIKQLRESANITQESLAALLGISQQAVAKWETGAGMPRASMLPEIARILHCNIEDFYSESNDSERK